MDQPATASLVSDMSSPVNLASSIDRLKTKASYNGTYKGANQQKNELGVKRLRMYEEELEIKHFEVKARKDEVKLRGLEVLYNDLRQDLKDAREMNPAEDTKMTREETQKVQK